MKDSKKDFGIQPTDGYYGYIPEKKAHGGKRKGAGRKKKEPTKPVRIPISWIDKVKAFIKS